MPKNPQNLHQPTYSHLPPGLDAESLRHHLRLLLVAIRLPRRKNKSPSPSRHQRGKPYVWLANCYFIPSQRARIALVVADLNAFVPDSIFGSNELSPESGHP
jgi:hypothetical protein